MRRYERETNFDAIDPEPASNYIRQVMLEGLLEIDPSASLQSFANIRIVGERFTDGVFDASAAEIFSLFDREIRAAAGPGTDGESFRLGFRTVRDGSVILPLETFPETPPAEGELPTSLPSSLERAFVRVLNLHDSVEEGVSPNTGEKSANALIHRLRMLIQALDEADAGIEIALSQSNGRRRESNLTHRGRQNAGRFFEQELTISLNEASGYLNGITIKGDFAEIELRHGKTKSDITGVPKEVAKRLEWDSFLRMEVRTETRADRFGEHRSVKNQFIRDLTRTGDTSQDGVW